MSTWDIPIRKGIAAFRDVPFVAASWTTMQNGLLWALPGREEFSLMIDRIVANYADRYYGLNALYPTGPVLLGKTFAQAMLHKGRNAEADDQHIGNCRCITPDDHMLNVSYVSKEGKLVALRTKSGGGDLTHIGLYGTNNYNTLWRSRQIYSEDVQTWHADDCNLELEALGRLTPRGIEAADGGTGRMSFGPFFALPAGRFTAKVHFSDDARCDRFCLDLCSGFGATILGECEGPIEGREFQLTFVNHEPRENVEFRTYVLERFTGYIEKITIETDQSYEVPPKDHGKQEWTWTHDSIDIRVLNVVRTPEGIDVPRGTRGRITYGPYVNLGPGRYKVACIFSDDTLLRRVSLDIGGGKDGDTLMVKRVENQKVVQQSSINTEFSLDDEVENVEFRISVDKYFCGKILALSLSKDYSSIV